MRRLIDLSASDPLTARAQLLVHALGPTVESEERLHRVRRALDTTSRAPLRRWALPAVLAAALLFASAAAATVALSGVRFQSAPAPMSTDLAASEPKAVKPRSVSRAAAAAPPQGPSPTADEAAPMPAVPVARAQLPSSDVARVHEAAKALRHDRDPQRALQLLERSGGVSTGPLAEEALALRIEALLASGNGRGAQLAAQYLKQYPRGRYRELAQRALADRNP